jgi:hypothetical protein
MIQGLDLGHANVTEAEHWLRETAAGLGPCADLFACTHLVHGERPRVALSVSVPLAATSIDPEVAARVALLHESRQGGRAVIYPGVVALTGTLQVADVLALSAIQEVRLLGGSPPPMPETLLETREFVRPQWLDGRLVLMATPAPGGRIAPFEVPNPTPCCAPH